MRLLQVMSVVCKAVIKTNGIIWYIIEYDTCFVLYFVDACFVFTT